MFFFLHSLNVRTECVYACECVCVLCESLIFITLWMNVGCVLNRVCTGNWNEPSSGLACVHIEYTHSTSSSFRLHHSFHFSNVLFVIFLFLPVFVVCLFFIFYFDSFCSFRLFHYVWAVILVTIYFQANECELLYNTRSCWCRGLSKLFIHFKNSSAMCSLWV